MINDPHVTTGSLRTTASRSPRARTRDLANPCSQSGSIVELSALWSAYSPAATMRQALIQRLIVTLCLVAFGLGQTVFVSMGVWCTDASGASRIEFGCFKSAQGACLTPCAEPDVHTTAEDHKGEPLSPSPCEDEPLGLQLSAANVHHPSLVFEPVFVAAVVAILWDSPWSIETEESARAVRFARERGRPPSFLTHMRSVILVV